MKKDNSTVLTNIFFIIFSLLFIIPFMYIISISVSNESMISQFGYKLIPRQIDFTAYKHIFATPHQLINSYKVTIIFSFATMFIGMLTMALMAYPLSRDCFKGGRVIMFLVFFTMLFGGGLIPSYIINTQYLHLGNSIWIYILPALVNPFYLIIIKTFFKDIPPALVESAKIDGANEYLIFFRIILPLSKPVLATVGLLTLLGQWNNWFTSLVYIRNANLYSLQYLLQKVLSEAQFIRNMIDKAPMSVISTSEIPMESMKFAMVVVAAGPALLAFPFFQKYFTRGLTIGSVKG